MQSHAHIDLENHIQYRPPCGVDEGVVLRSWLIANEYSSDSVQLIPPQLSRSWCAWSKGTPLVHVRVAQLSKHEHIQEFPLAFLYNLVPAQADLVLIRGLLSNLLTYIDQLTPEVVICDFSVKGLSDLGFTYTGHHIPHLNCADWSLLPRESCCILRSQIRRKDIPIFSSAYQSAASQLSGMHVRTQCFWEQLADYVNRHPNALIMRDRGSDGYAIASVLGTELRIHELITPNALRDLLLLGAMVNFAQNQSLGCIGLHLSPNHSLWNQIKQMKCNLVEGTMNNKLDVMVRDKLGNRSTKQAINPFYWNCSSIPWEIQR